MLEPFRSVEDCRHDPFGTAIELPDRFRTQPVNPLLLELGRHRRGPVPDGLERGHIVLRSDRFREARNAHHHGRNEAGPGYRVLVDETKRLFGIETLHADNRMTFEQGLKVRCHRHVVIDWPCGEDWSLGRKSQGRLLLVIESIRTRRHDNLRAPRRPSGRHRLPIVGEHWLQGRKIIAIATQVGGECPERTLQMRIACYDHGGLGNFDDRSQFGFG